jgi:hypothetical protein
MLSAEWKEGNHFVASCLFIIMNITICTKTFLWSLNTQILPRIPDYPSNVQHLEQFYCA